MTSGCAVCGGRRVLTDHHIHPESFRESYPNGSENINEGANLVTLCRACHDCVHERKPLHVILREVKQKLRRPRKEKNFKCEEQRVQSEKDTARLLEGWKALLVTLEDPAMRQQIESYRRIIITVERLHLRVIGKDRFGKANNRKDD